MGRLVIGELKKLVVSCGGRTHVKATGIEIMATTLQQVTSKSRQLL
jgi:hypothetical protein